MPGFPPNRQASRRVSRWSLLVSVVVTLALAAVSASMLLDLRRDAWNQATLSSESLLKVLAQDIARTLEIYDLSMQGVVDGLNRPEMAGMSPGLRQVLLFDRAANLRDAGPLLVVDERGKVVIDSAGWPARQAAIDTDRDYFSVHRDGQSGGLYIGRALVSTITGHEIVPLSRRLSHPDGSFAGIVLGAIRLNYFKSLFSRLALGENGIVALLRADGTMLVREPRLEDDAARNLAASPTFLKMLEKQHGRTVAHSVLDGVERLFTFRAVGDLPLRITVARSTGDILAGWYRKAWLIGAIVAGLCGMTIGFALLLARELKRRERAEAATLAANEELTEIAVTDPLTALFNRRRFDDLLAQEWRRASRNGAPLSLVLLDADFFKAFNDRYGHHAGDVALRAIATAILAQGRRPGDAAFRIGGEEFAMILAETELEGAYALAERLRAEVLAAGIPHPDSPSGLLSVSIGVTAMEEGDEPVSLFARADTALYEAKRMGRNRTVHTGEMSLVPQPRRLPESAFIALGTAPPRHGETPVEARRRALLH
jgi:diguanylate cyclase (GGDEF)-like protein